MKVSGWGVVACGVILLTQLTSGQAPRGAAPNARQFAEQAMMANTAEIKLGELAERRAQSQAVKEFAQMMVREHTKARNELTQAVKGNDIQAPTQLDAKHQGLYDRLNALNGAEFDREYMAAMVEGHRDVKNMLDERANQSSYKPTGTTGNTSEDAALNRAVNQWSTNALPTVSKHLQRAEQISGQLK